MHPRLFPEIPGSQFISFYPMDRRRGEHKNWYKVPMPERQRQMQDHGEIGRRYAGKVRQIISGSIGFDDWEWGVDLFADDPGAWRRVIDIDLTAVIDGTRLAVRAMRRAGNGGVIVNLASLIGLYPMAAAPVYAAAKAGVVHFTRSLASLAGDCGIRVNAICPELVDTPLALAMGEEQMAALRASQSVLTPEEVAAWVVRLVEDDSRAGAIVQITKAEGGIYVE